MRVVVTTEERYIAMADGTVWSGSAGSSFYERYLRVFDRVRILARVKQTDHVPVGWSRVDTPCIEVCSVPYYHGLKQYLLKRREVIRAVGRAFDTTDAIVLRSGQIAELLSASVVRRSHPFGLEVVSDPYDVFAPGSVRHPLRPFLRWWAPRTVRRLCRRADAVAYVTAFTLQRRYPASSSAYQTQYSSIELPRSTIVESARSSEQFTKCSHDISFVGSLDQMYKGPDVLVFAVGECIRRGFDLRLVMIGDGKHRQEIQQLVERCGIANRVELVGQLPGMQAVQRLVDRSDLFVLPSRTEGLPRAMIEAMARAVPCIGTRVGGIPELLLAEDMVAPGDAEGLADKICEVLSRPERMSDMSLQNLRKANEYREDILVARRDAFYSHLRELTTKKLRNQEGVANVM